VCLDVRCERLQNQEVMLRIGVSDTGKGMTPEQLAVLSAEYTRFHEAEDRSTYGTGLGMSIVYGFVNMMRGTISVESTVGVGTLFRLAIPQIVAGTEVMGRVTAQNLREFNTANLRIQHATEITFESMSHASVLVVDDVDINLFVAQKLMHFYDLQVETALSGQLAIDKVNEGKTYDIIFMDHMMPGMSGVEAVRLIRGLGYSGIIVAFTANTMLGQAEEFIGDGFDDVLQKPIQSAQLDIILKKYIPRSLAQHP